MPLTSCQTPQTGRDESAAKRAHNVRSAVHPGETWAGVHELALKAARYAGETDDRFAMDAIDFRTRFDAMPQWRVDLVAQAVDDLDAVLSSGVAALDTIADRGGRCDAAAHALWHEFLRAQNAIATLLKPAD